MKAQQTVIKDHRRRGVIGKSENIHVESLVEIAYQEGRGTEVARQECCWLFCATKVRRQGRWVLSRAGHWCFPHIQEDGQAGSSRWLVRFKTLHGMLRTVRVLGHDKV